MECSICFGECENQCTLTCTHAFCKACIVKWLESSTQLEGPSCPMCRGPILFKGFQKIQGTLEETRWNAAYDETYAELFDDLIERERDMRDRWMEVASEEESPRVANLLRNLGQRMMTEQCALILGVFGRTFNAMKANGEHPEDIQDLVYEGTINYEREVKRARRSEWKGREPHKLRNTQRRTQMRRFV